ncbi:MAG: ribosome-binding factor A [Candidatus Paceibacterota bacterium]
MTTTFRDEKLKDQIKKWAAEFLQRESNGNSLITVTDVKISTDAKEATILFTVLPESKQEAALEFARRQLSEFREFLGKKVKIGRMPFFHFDIDRGEKHRQRIDEITIKN